jgi:predicted ABC-type ATPase
MAAAAREREGRAKDVHVSDEEPTLVLVGGPNGTGKSSLIRKLVSDGWIQRVVNPDALQSALGPATAARVEAGREALTMVDHWIQQKASFMWETTLASASQTYVARIHRAKDAGYRIGLHFIWLSSQQMCIERVQSRFQAGGHFIENSDILRRYPRCARNFLKVFRVLADEWYVWNNDQDEPRLMGSGAGHKQIVYDQAGWKFLEEVALGQA